MRNRRAAVLWGLTAGYAGAIFVLSSLPVPAPAEEPLALIGDKSLHALEYGVFSALLALAIATAPSPRVRGRAALLALAGAAMYGATDELHQALVPGRRADVFDFGWDLIGAAVGAAAYAWWTRRTSRGAPRSDTSPR